MCRISEIIWSDFWNVMDVIDRARTARGGIFPSQTQMSYLVATNDYLLCLAMFYLVATNDSDLELKDKDK